MGYDTHDMWDVAFHTAAEPPKEPDALHAYDAGLVDVIQEAHRRGYTVSSNYAREHSAYIGMAASLGMLTTRVHNNVYSREWRPTVLGLSLLNESELDD